MCNFAAILGGRRGMCKGGGLGKPPLAPYIRP